MSRKLSVRIHSAKIIALTSILACALVALTSLNTFANTVTIHDTAGVLNVGKVQSAANQIKNPLLITTTNTFTGDEDSFKQQTLKLLPSEQAISIGVDTTHHFFAVEGGTATHLSDSQANDVYEAFKNNFNGGDYTGAMIAALGSLHDDLSGTSQNTPSAGAIVGIVLVALFIAVVAISAIFRRRRGNPPGGGGRNRRWGWWNNGFYAGSGAYTNMGTGTHTHHGAGGSFGGGNYGGGAGGSFGGGSFGGGGGFGGGAGGSF